MIECKFIELFLKLQILNESQNKFFDKSHVT
jgi:hypothetical protein